jgi:hypothetical protein
MSNAKELKSTRVEHFHWQIIIPKRLGFDV